ncbi:MAG: nuclear transport factor 2 family protein [Terracidiphilus sp.]|jgi:ketosteroid isomerase-like protein
MRKSPISVAHAFVRAINRHQVDDLAALMTEEHCFIGSVGNTVRGRQKIQGGWAAYFLMVPDYSIAVEETYSDGPAVVMLGNAEGTYAPDGKLSPENRWKTPAAFRALVEHGKVAEWRVYADNEPIRERMKKKE